MHVGKWFWLGVGAAGAALASAFFVRYYREEQRRHRELADPRARQVRALIEEAEKLLLRGRGGVVDPPPV